MLKYLPLSCLLVALALSAVANPQLPSSPAPAKPTEHVVGSITAIDPSFKKLTVKEDKTGTEYTVSLEDTKTFLKVSPSAKDLKSAVRFTPNDLQVNDRVSVRGYKMDGVPNGIAAASVLLMSARDLQEEHHKEMEAWQHSTAGVVSSVDSATKQLKVSVRVPGSGPKIVAVDGANAQFTRYSPKGPIPSQLSDIQPGDQVRIIGNQNEDGSIITAQKIYSGTFRTIAGTVASISPDGKELTILDRQTKQPVHLQLTDTSTIRRLSPDQAAQLAQRPAGDLSRVLSNTPAIPVSDLKPGDTVIASAGVVPGSPLAATNIVVGVEPILQASAARRRNHSSETGNDWNLDLAIPSE